MKRTLSILISLLALSMGLLSAQSVLTIQGQVTNDSTGAPVAHHNVLVRADSMMLPGGGNCGGGTQPSGPLGMALTDSNGYYSLTLTLANPNMAQVYVITHGCMMTVYSVAVPVNAGTQTVNFSICVGLPGGGNPGGGNPGGGNPGGGNPGGGNPGGGNPGGGNPGGGHPGGGNPGGGVPGMGCHAYFGGHPDSTNLLTWNFHTMPKSPTATYEWSFGDGNTASGLNVSNTYAAFGQYNVCLVLTDTAFQCLDTVCILVNVDSTWHPGGMHPGGGHPGGGHPGGGNGIPGMGCHAKFVGHPDSTNLLEWHFHAMSKSPTATFAWEFGDGNTGAGQDVTNTYVAFGSYNVCLVMTDTAHQCVDTFCILVNVDSTWHPGGHHPGGGHPGGGNPGGGQGMNCNADFSWAFDSTGAVAFTDLSTPVPTSWLWNFGDGGTSTVQNPVYAYQAPGTYFVTLSIGYTNCSCTDSTMQTVTLAVSIDAILATHTALGNEAMGNLYPNPAQQSVKFELSTAEAGEVSTLVLDMSGRIVMSQVQQVNAGTESIQLNLSGLMEGSYLLMVRHENGMQYVRKLNKVR